MAQLDRRVMSVWRWSIVLWGALAAVVGGGLAWLVLHHFTPLWIAAPPIVLGGTALAAWLVPERVWSNWSYELGDDALELAHGVLFKEHSVVPWSRVQHVDLSHGPLDRRQGLAQLKIHTASAKTDAKLPGIEQAQAEQLRLEILDRYRRASSPT